MELLTWELRQRRHEVVSFVEGGTAEALGIALDDPDWIASEDGQSKFYHNIAGATSTLAIYIGPSGPDAWAEVGVAYSRGIPIWGLRSKGETIGINALMIHQWFGDVFMLLLSLGDGNNGL